MSVQVRPMENPADVISAVFPKPFEGGTIKSMSMRDPFPGRPPARRWPCAYVRRAAGARCGGLRHGLSGGEKIVEVASREAGGTSTRTPPGHQLVPGCRWGRRFPEFHVPGPSLRSMCTSSISNPPRIRQRPAGSGAMKEGVHRRCPEADEAEPGLPPACLWGRKSKGEADGHCLSDLDAEGVPLNPGGAEKPAQSPFHPPVPAAGGEREELAALATPCRGRRCKMWAWTNSSSPTGRRPSAGGTAGREHRPADPWAEARGELRSDAISGAYIYPSPGCLEGRRTVWATTQLRRVELLLAQPLGHRRGGRDGAGGHGRAGAGPSGLRQCSQPETVAAPLTPPVVASIQDVGVLYPPRRCSISRWAACGESGSPLMGPLRPPLSVELSYFFVQKSAAAQLFDRIAPQRTEKEHSKQNTACDRPVPAVRAVSLCWPRR